MYLSAWHIQGKTESTKQVLRFLALNSSRIVESLPVDVFVKDVEALINAVNPITESFGNAKVRVCKLMGRWGARSGMVLYDTIWYNVMKCAPPCRPLEITTPVGSESSSSWTTLPRVMCMELTSTRTFWKLCVSLHS